MLSQSLVCLLDSPALDDPDYRSQDLRHEAGVKEGVPVSTTDDVVLAPHLHYHVLHITQLSYSVLPHD